MAPPVLTLISQRARALRGHPWVYTNEVAALLPATHNGQWVELRDSRGAGLGLGLYNGLSQICWRRWAPPGQSVDETWLEGLFRRALARRPPGSCRRLVWSEADGMPGLVADQYGDVIVAQALTLGVDRQRSFWEKLFRQWLPIATILWRNDAPSRQLEGLPKTVGTASGEPCPPRWLAIDGVEYWLDLAEGHKTGFYLDQREQRQLVAGYAAGRRVLDGCCHTGGFALHCAQAGATAVLGVEVSADCVALARRNAERNRLAIDFQEANLFDWFTAHDREQFGLIVLDPPSFARNRAAVAAALRGYKEINRRAFQALEPDGVLATYSCSQHVSREEFLALLAEAAADAQRTARLLHLTGQPPDHPVCLHVPESSYLKGAIIRVD